MADRQRTDHLQAHIPGDRRQALASGREMPDRVSGSALFADVSGFTALTEALAAELGPQRGVEELTGVLDDVFREVIEDIAVFGGHVISFSGDAVTCWLDGDDGSCAAAAALAVQQTITRVGRVVTPGGRVVDLGIKIAIAVGPARRFVVGDPSIQLIDVLAGSIVDELAEAEQLAERGEIVLGPSAVVALGSRAEVSLAARKDATVAILEALTADVTPAERLPEPILDEVLVRPWLLPVVHARLGTGRGEFLTELRSAYPIFVRFGGIDFDADDAPGELDVFVRRSQSVLASFGGNVLQLILGDKGAYIYGVFGSPVTHGDDAARVAAAALELRSAAADTAARDLQIGIAVGRLRSGTYGHPHRKTFTCLGDAVNLSARLMSGAAPDTIRVTDEVRREAGERFTWATVGTFAVKGRFDPVTVWSLDGVALANRQREVRYTLPMVGRDRELGAIADAADAVRGGSGRVVAISAEAGRGKSRLVAEVVRRLRADGMPVAFGEASVVESNGSYVVWREVFHTLLGIDAAASDTTRTRVLRRSLAGIGRGQASRAPLLGPLLGLDVPDTEVTRAFDAKLRKSSLESLLLDVLISRSSDTPITIVLEDCHRIDPLSRDLLEVLVRGSEQLPVLFLIDYRPTGSVGGGLGLDSLLFFDEFELTELGSEAARSAANAKIAQLYGDDVQPAPELIEAVVTRAQGNPFYLEQILNFLHGRGLDPARPEQLHAIELPASLHSLLLSRIDTLDESPRRTIKVASVLGRRFEAPAIRRVYPDLGSDADVAGHLDVGNTADLVVPDEDKRSSWLFRHVITREVAYQSLPHTLRVNLHERAALDMEAHGPEAMESDLDLLTHHWCNSDRRDKQIEYLERAGDAAQARYANTAASDYFERLSAFVVGSKRADVLRRLGKVLELTGEWDRARSVVSEAAALATTAGDSALEALCEVSLAEVARKQGRFDDALGHLGRASQCFDLTLDESGRAQVLHLAGTVAAQRGDRSRARTNYEASLEIRRRLDENGAAASVLSNLGVVAEYDGDLAASRNFHESALVLRREVGDRWALAVSHTNLGMIDLLEGRSEDATASFGEAMRLNREVGDRWMVAISHHNLANACRALGDIDGARSNYRHALTTFVTYNDHWALAFLFEDVALLAHQLGEVATAWELIGAADACRTAVGTPRPSALEADLVAQLAGSVENVGETSDADARALGERAGRDEMVNVVLRLCGEPPPR